jgi:site-specific DNA recombinase
VIRIHSTRSRSLTAAIYARKSTDQAGFAEEQKSVARQVEHARAYAARKGWAVLDEAVFVDDGISGAEFANRPGFLRLMNALKPRAAFQMLIMSEVSRLGREQIETAMALKQLSVAGVRCFSYLDERELLMDNATDKFLLGAVTFAADLEREKARQRTYDAMERKAKAGHVTGGRVFGYENTPVYSEPDGQGRTHRIRVERCINDAEAEVVRRIYRWSAEGWGYARIAKTLNAERALCPRPQQGRPAGWSPSTILEILRRPLYRGEIRWAQTRKRDQWGHKKQQARADGEVLRVAAPQLRIVPETLWQAVVQRRPSLQLPRRQPGHRSSGPGSQDREAKYLLSGFARCAKCGGGMCATSRSHGSRRAHFYSCLAQRSD